MNTTPIPTQEEYEVREARMQIVSTSELIKLIRVKTIPTGHARIEGRAPSHDGEYVTVIALADDCWLATRNSGVYTGSEGDWFEGDDRYPGYDELQETAAAATGIWDFDADPARYGSEAQDCIECWLRPQAWTVEP